jgi:hypothetical protein
MQRAVVAICLVVLVTAVIVIAVVPTGVRWRGHRETDVRHFQEMIESEKLIGLTVPEAERLMGYRAQTRPNPDWPLEFYLRHLGFVWISITVRDGIIVEAQLIFD